MRPVGDESSPGEDGGHHATAVFLSLYLLLTTFFIALVSMSSLERRQSEAVMNSLAATFASNPADPFASGPIGLAEPELMAQHAFQQDIAVLFATYFRAAEVEVVGPGDLRISIDSDAVFRRGTSEIRDRLFPLFDRLVALLSAPPSGLDIEMEFRIGRPSPEIPALDPSPAAEIRRAGAWGRTLIARGAPARLISMAIEPGKSDDIVVLFRARPRTDDPETTTEAGSAGGDTGMDDRR